MNNYHWLIILIFILNLDSIFSSQWIKADNGLPTSGRVNSILVKDNYIFCAGYGLGINYSTNEGQLWQAINNGLSTLNILCLYSKDSILYCGTDKGIFKLNYNQFKWESISDGLPNCYVNSIAYKAGVFYAGTSKGLFFSYNEGKNWSISDEFYFNNSISQISVSDKYIFVAINMVGLFFSTNNGLTWTRICGDSYTDYFAISNLRNNFYIASDRKLDPCQLNNDSLTIHSYTADCILASNNYIFYGSVLGLFRNDSSYNEVQMWGGNNVYSIAFKGDYIFIGLNHGIYKMNVDYLGVEVDNELISFNTFPNPVEDKLNVDIFSNSSNIESLKIIDILGNSLHSFNNVAYKNSFDISWLCKGSYFIELKMNGRTFTKKFIKI